MPEIIDLTLSQPEPARTPSPAPSIEWVKTIKTEPLDGFLDINDFDIKPEPIAADEADLIAIAEMESRSSLPAAAASLPADESDLVAIAEMESRSSLHATAVSPPSRQPAEDHDDDEEEEEEGALRRLSRLSIKSFETVEELITEVQAAAARVGFAVVRRRSSNYSEGKPTRVDLECAEGPAHVGKSNAVVGAKPRPGATTSKKDCLWKAKAVYLKKWCSWHFVILSKHHTHILKPDTIQYMAVNRRLQRTEDVTASIIRQSKQARSTANDIAATVREEFPDVVITKRDVINTLATHREKEAGALTPTQQFLNRLFTTPGIQSRVFREDGSEDQASLARVERVFWTYPWCIEQLRQNPDVWSLDCTYKVNKFNMPLLQICGITSMHTTFNIGYCILSGEKEECFAWVFNQLDKLLIKEKIPRPSVIITDYDKACKKAMRTVFSDVQHQICLWHVMKNVAFNTKKKWHGSLEGTALGNRGSDGSHLKDDHIMDINPANKDHSARQVASRLLNKEDRVQHLDEGIKNAQLKDVEGLVEGRRGQRKWVDTADGILAAWNAVVYAPTEEDFNREWLTLKADFGTKQLDLVTYLENTYLPLRWEFAHFAISTYRNFGIRVTSRTEGAHGILKSQLINRHINLDGLLKAIETTLDRLKHNFAQKYAHQISRSVHQYDHKILQTLKFVISFAALDKLAMNIRTADGKIRDKREGEICSGNFRRQHGLPCWHDMVSLLKTGGWLEHAAIDPHWFLNADKPLTAAALAIRREQDPKPVVTKRWQTLNGPQALPFALRQLAALEEAQEGSSVRCAPAHDAPPSSSKQPPKKKARITATQQLSQYKGMIDSSITALQQTQASQAEMARENQQLRMQIAAIERERADRHRAMALTATTTMTMGMGIPSTQPNPYGHQQYAQQSQQYGHQQYAQSQQYGHGQHPPPSQDMPPPSNQYQQPPPSNQYQQYRWQ